MVALLCMIALLVESTKGGASPRLPMLEEAIHRVSIHGHHTKLLVTDASPETTLIPITSPDGREYLCSLPTPEKGGDGKDQGSEERPDPQERVRIPESQLLAPLKDECVYKAEGWWTYEVCYGSHVRQFHADPKTQQVLAEFFLGRESPSSSSSSSPSPPLGGRYSEEYVGGTVCDLTGKPRKTTVFFACSPSGLNSLSAVSEPATCEYTVTLSTPLLCAHDEYAVDDQPEIDISCVLANEVVSVDDLFAQGGDVEGAAERPMRDPDTPYAHNLSPKWIPLLQQGLEKAHIATPASTPSSPSSSSSSIPTTKLEMHALEKNALEHIVNALLKDQGFVDTILVEDGQDEHTSEILAMIAQAQLDQLNNARPTHPGDSDSDSDGDGDGDSNSDGDSDGDGEEGK